jgi:amidase
MMVGEWTATKALAAMARGDVGSEELLDAQLARIDDVNGDINAVVTVDERARERCRRADDERRSGRVRGRLHGLPITVKDVFETAGLRTTAGASELATYVPVRDAVAVSSLKAAGAVVFGKTNVPTYAADFQTDNPLFGLTRNPWDLSIPVNTGIWGVAIR